MKILFCVLSVFLAFGALADTYEVDTKPESIILKRVHHLRQASAKFIESDSGVKISLTVRYKKIGARGETSRTFYFKPSHQELQLEGGRIVLQTPHQTVSVATLEYSALDIFKIFPQWIPVHDDLIQVEKHRTEAGTQLSIVLRIQE